MRWERSWRADPRGARLADRHYSRQKIGAAQFVPPGGCVVFVAGEAPRSAVWVTSTPLAEWVKHAWAGAWINSLFRNEGAGLSSELILEAVAATRYVLGAPPPLGMVTFVDAGKVRRKRDPGRCYRRAGFRHVGETKEDGLLAFQLLPAEMPEPEAPRNAQCVLVVPA
jgi:hypothetical protein